MATADVPSSVLRQSRPSNSLQEKALPINMMGRAFSLTYPFPKSHLNQPSKFRRHGDLAYADFPMTMGRKFEKIELR